MKNNEKKVSSFETKMSAEERNLNKYLYEYVVLIKRKKELEQRKAEIKKEFSYIKSPNLDSVSSGVIIGENGAEKLIDKLDEIDGEIKKQIDRAIKKVSEIIKIISFLQIGSIERGILEKKYIDRMTWDEICKKETISKSCAKRHWKKGLDELLKKKEVRDILEKKINFLD